MDKLRGKRSREGDATMIGEIRCQGVMCRHHGETERERWHVTLIVSVTLNQEVQQWEIETEPIFINRGEALSGLREMAHEAIDTVKGALSPAPIEWSEIHDYKNPRPDWN